MIHQHAKFQAIPAMSFPENARTPQIWSVSLSKKSAKMSKINRPWPKSNQFCTWPAYITIPNRRPLCLCILQKMPANPKWTDGQTDRMANAFVELLTAADNMISFLCFMRFHGMSQNIVKHSLRFLWYMYVHIVHNWIWHSKTRNGKRLYWAKREHEQPIMINIGITVHE